jgi:hypothetical protein
MDRLKLETVYLRALDALMSADEYQIRPRYSACAGPRLACTGGKCRGLQLSTHPRGEPPSRSLLTALYASP